MKNLIFVFIIFVVLTGCSTVRNVDFNEHWREAGKTVVFRNISQQDHARDFWQSEIFTGGKKFSSVEITLTKQNGNEYSGFGVIYNYVDSANFSRLLINLDQSIQLATKKNGSYTITMPWVQTPLLNRGLYATNKIGLVKSGEDGYWISINDKLFVTFTDLAGLNGRIGYYAVVHEKENTPGDVFIEYSLIGKDLSR